MQLCVLQKTEHWLSGFRQLCFSRCMPFSYFLLNFMFIVFIFVFLSVGRLPQEFGTLYHPVFLAANRSLPFSSPQDSPLSVCFYHPLAIRPQIRPGSYQKLVIYKSFSMFTNMCSQTVIKTERFLERVLCFHWYISCCSQTLN